MKVNQLFNRTFAMMFRNAALWVVTLSMLLVDILFGILVGEITIFTAILTTLVALAITAIITGALVRIFDEMAEGRNPTVREGFGAGGRTVVPLMLVQLILQVPVWIVAFASTGSLMDAFGPLGSPEALSGGTLLASLGSISLAVVVILLVSLFTNTIAIGAQRAVVLEDSPVLAAVARGWNLLWSQLISYLKIGLAAVVVSLALGVVLACPLSLAIGAAAFGSAAATGSASATGSGTTAVLAVATILSLLVSTLSQILLNGVWTLAFRHWQGKDSNSLP
jgi:hypothetical protein